MVTSLPQLPLLKPGLLERGHTDRKQRSLLAVQGQLLALIAAGCQQDKIQQDSRED